METPILSKLGINIFRWSSYMKYSSQHLAKVSISNSLPLNDVGEVPTFIKPAFNFAAFVQKSESLQNLLKLGVNFQQLEKRKGIPDYLLKLDFERDMKSHIRFLHDLDVPTEKLGKFLTINPLIFKEEIVTLALRVYYLQSKNFSVAQISRVITNNPYWLMFSTKRIDRRCGFFQEQFNLKGDDFRFLASKQPTLITYNLNHIRQNNFSIKEEMGFDDDEIRCLILSKPKIWMMNRPDLMKKYDYIHEQMKLTNAQILDFPNLLTTRLWKLKQRHEFLKYLGRAKYDPNQDLFVSPKAMLEGTDKDFVLNVAKSSILDYNNFLKTL